MPPSGRLSGAGSSRTSGASLVMPGRSSSSPPRASRSRDLARASTASSPGSSLRGRRGAEWEPADWGGRWAVRARAPARRPARGRVCREGVSGNKNRQIGVAGGRGVRARQHCVQPGVEPAGGGNGNRLAGSGTQAGGLQVGERARASLGCFPHPQVKPPHTSLCPDITLPAPLHHTSLCPYITLSYAPASPFPAPLLHTFLRPNITLPCAPTSHFPAPQHHTSLSSNITLPCAPDIIHHSPFPCPTA
eukprot:352033-Chlamydomonas_euryale.AAC.4